MANKKKPLKKQKIRNSEYYDMQLALDELYAASVKGQRFCNLVELIKRPENIKLAYRNIRKNSGSRTAGVDNIAIFKIKAYSRMNGTNLHSPVELQPEMHAESHLEEHPMSLL